MKLKNINFFKYIFILIVIALIGGAIYILYYSSNMNKEVEEDVDEQEEIISPISIVDNFKMGIANYDTMNPILTKNKEIANLDRLIFEPLVNITSDFKTENCLAKSIEKKDALTYEIKIDNAIKWQDGTNFFAKDIQFTVNKIKEYDSIYKANVEHIESVEAPDAETVIIKLNEDVPFFEYDLSFPIMSSAYYVNEDFALTGKIPIGTGMYRIGSIDNDNILLIRNDRWRDIKTKIPKTQSITIHRYNAQGELFNTFKLGNIDSLTTYMPNYSEYIGTLGYNKKEFLGRSFDFISFNCEDNVLKNKEVRQAINYSINRQEIVSSALYDTKSVSRSPLDYGNYLYNAEGCIENNVDEAKKILQNNGWVYTNGKWQKSINGYVRKLSINLIINYGNDERARVASQLKNQLADAGIILNVVKVSDDKYYECLNNKDYQMILAGVNNSINPSLSYYFGDGNIANYNNDDIKSKLNSLDSYKEIQKIAYDEVPYIGLYRNKGYLILNANVGGNFALNNFFTYYNFNEWYRQQ